MRNGYKLRVAEKSQIVTLVQAQHPCISLKINAWIVGDARDDRRGVGFSAIREPNHARVIASL
jgi:hypothetical protein